jgi:hypothetical protein
MTKALIPMLLIAVGIVAMLGPLHSGYAPTTTGSPSLIVGTAAVRPDIDGVWQASEWNDAVEARLALYSKQVNNKGEVYVRLKHDNNSLYGLIDAVSDNGSTWIDDGNTVTGSAQMFFDGNNNGFIDLGDKNDFVLVISPNDKGKGLYVQFQSLDGANFTTQALVDDELGPSPHSSASHRVYEISVPMKLITGGTQGTQSKTIGFNIGVQDSYQNLLTLSKNQSPVETAIIVIVQNQPLPRLGLDPGSQGDFRWT